MRCKFRLSIRHRTAAADKAPALRAGCLRIIVLSTKGYARCGGPGPRGRWAGGRPDRSDDGEEHHHHGPDREAGKEEVDRNPYGPARKKTSELQSIMRHS